MEPDGRDQLTFFRTSFASSVTAGCFARDQTLVSIYSSIVFPFWENDLYLLVSLVSTNCERWFCFYALGLAVWSGNTSMVSGKKSRTM